MQPRPEMFGAASLSIAQGIGAFQAFLPKFSDVRRHDPQSNPDFAADVRMGEVAAVTVTLGIGAITSSLVGSPVPAVVSAAVCLVLVVLYESTLVAHDPMQPKSARSRLTLVKDESNG